MTRTPWLLLALLGLPLVAGCPTATGDDDSGDDDDTSADDDDAADDDDSGVGDDDDSGAGDDDDDDAADDDDSVDLSGWSAIVSYGSFAGDATLASIDLSDHGIDDGLLGLAGSDWGLDSADGDVWLIGRFFIDTIRRYAGTDFSAPTLEFSTGAGTNPQDLAVCDGKLFVARYDRTEDQTAGGDVAIFDLSTGGPLGAVDLSAWDPHADGTPEPAGLFQFGDLLYVVLQRLDRDNSWTADAVGKIVEIDCASGATTGNSWDVGSNPALQEIAAGGPAVFVRHATGFQMFDAEAGTVEDLVSGADIGPNTEILAMVAVGEKVLMVTEVDWATNHVLCVDQGGGAPTPIAAVDHRSWGLRVAPDGTVWGLWRDHWATEDVEVGGIAIYDPETCADLTAGGWLAFDADPFELLFYEDPE